MLGVTARGAGATLARHELLLLLDVGGYEVVEEEERLRVHSHKDVILEVRHKAAVDMRHAGVVHTGRSLSLNAGVNILR